MINPFTLPFEIDPGIAEGLLYEVPYRMASSLPDHIIIRGILLEYEPHAIYIFRGKSPVSLGVQVAEVKPFLSTSQYIEKGSRDLPCDKGFTTSRGFMVKEDPVTGEEVVSLPVVYRNPVRINLGRRIGTPRIERGLFILRRGRGAEHLGGGCLVKLCLYAASSDGLKNPHCAKGCNIAGILRDLKTDHDMTLGAKVIDLVRFDIVDDLRHLPRVGEVSIMEKESCPCLMGIDIDVIDPPRVKGAGPPDDTMHLITLGKQQLRQVTSILTCDPCN